MRPTAAQAAYARSSISFPLPIFLMPSSAVETVRSVVAGRVKRAVSEPLLNLDEHQQKSAMSDSSWADGLRGIAALYVVSSHIVLCIARSLVRPCCVNDASDTPALFQRPIFRLVAQGHSWVALFFILMGFVNALKPIKLSRQGQQETALSNLALSSFRRTFRLILPASTATIISWFVCQMGMYETARNGDAWWLYTYTPSVSESWGTALEDLVYALRMTWSFTDVNAYDQPQWALVYLLMGSIFVFCGMLMTVNLTPGWRVASMVGFALWSLDWSIKTRDPLVGLTVFSGVALAEFSLSDFVQGLVPISPVLTPILVVFSLVLMSHPGADFADRAGWSNILATFSKTYFKNEALSNDLIRTYGSFGAILLVFAIIISPHARRLLSQGPLLWLGKVSFPIYLLHGTFMRTVFAWVLFRAEPESFQVEGADGNKYSIERYPQGGIFKASLAVILTLLCTLVAAHYWTKKLEPRFAAITKAAEEMMTGGPRGGANGQAMKMGANGKTVLPITKLG